MREIQRYCRLGQLYFILLFAAAGMLELRGQNSSRTTSATVSAPEELSQAELLEAYRNLREQLRATQTAIVNNRFETEATAREQAAALAEKIEAMNANLAAERKNRQAEADRFEFVREQQQTEIRRSNRAVVWVASGFGVIGLLAMVVAAFFQWRAINRMAEVVGQQRPQLAASSDFRLLPGSLNPLPPSQPVAQSTQRLLSALDRMEQRIKELEHTAAPQSAAPFSSTNPPNQTHDAIA